MSIDPKLVGSQNWSATEWAEYWREKYRTVQSELTAVRQLLDMKTPCNISVNGVTFAPGCAFSSVVREVQFVSMKRRVEG